MSSVIMNTAALKNWYLKKLVLSPCRWIPHFFPLKKFPNIFNISDFSPGFQNTNQKNIYTFNQAYNTKLNLHKDN